MNSPNTGDQSGCTTVSCTLCGHPIVYGPKDQVPDEPVCANH